MYAQMIYAPTFALGILLAWPALGADSQAKSTPTIPEIEKRIQDFQNRIGEYMKLHKRVEADMPPFKPTRDPAKITEHERALAGGLREARARAKQGDIFTPEIAAEFRRSAAITVKGKEAVRIHKSLKAAEPGARVPLEVNAAYPGNVPLQSMPPTLLRNLPKLPPDMEYCIVGHVLVLRDIDANMIVDYLNDAVP